MTPKGVGLAILASLALSLAGCATYELNPPAPEAIRAEIGDVVDPQEIVVLVDTQAQADRLAQGAAAQGYVLREDVALDGLGQRLLRLDMPAGVDGPTGIAELEAILPGATAGVNHAYRMVAVNGAGQLDYATALMQWPAGGCPATSPIGMLDSAVDPNVAKAAGADLVAKSFARGAQTPARHGSDVAAVLLDPARLTGATLYSAGVIGRSARGREEAGVDSLLKALDWMAANGVWVVNVSLSGPYNKLLDRGVDIAAGRGMVLVAAVGNDGAQAAPRYPAALHNVIAVTAVDARRAIYGKAVRGPHVDVAAPGVDLFVAGAGGGRFVTGTSMAAPLVSARIASDPDLAGAGADAVRRALGARAADLGTPGADTTFGAGLVTAGGQC